MHMLSPRLPLYGPACSAAHMNHDTACKAGRCLVPVHVEHLSGEANLWNEHEYSYQSKVCESMGRTNVI